MLPELPRNSAPDQDAVGDQTRPELLGQIVTSQALEELVVPDG